MVFFTIAIWHYFTPWCQVGPWEKTISAIWLSKATVQNSGTTTDGAKNLNEFPSWIAWPVRVSLIWGPTIQCKKCTARLNAAQVITVNRDHTVVHSELIKLETGINWMKLPFIQPNWISIFNLSSNRYIPIYGLLHLCPSCPVAFGIGRSWLEWRCSDSDCLHRWLRLSRWPRFTVLHGERRN